MSARLALACLFCLSGCAAIPDKPPPEPSVQYKTINVPTPVPCFTEAERPIRPQPTPIDLDTATTDQMVAAIWADNLLEEAYDRAIEDLFVKCMKAQGKEPK